MNVEYGYINRRSSIWEWPQFRPSQHQLNADAPEFISYTDGMMRENTRPKHSMDEFRRIGGVDTPYDPDQERWMERPIDIMNGEGRHGQRYVSPESSNAISQLTDEQIRVLRSLPNHIIYELLSAMDLRRLNIPRRAFLFMECRFCKNNGERQSFFRSHCLKDESGRVKCPILRKFVCTQCGLTGDYAHTIKYCPVSTSEERMASSAMLKSERMASGRRRWPTHSQSREEYATIGNLNLSQSSFNNAESIPLTSDWLELERKLEMFC